MVIHWVANPGTSALNNRNYFENLKLGTRGIYASSHYIVGLEGEILQCIPTNEIAYHAKNANQYSLGIEVCHSDWEGAFNQASYKALITLCAQLYYTYHLDPKRTCFVATILRAKSVLNFMYIILPFGHNSRLM